MPDSPIDRYLTELRQSPFLADTSVPGSFESMAEYYARHARRKRLNFRVASVVLIVLGALLPVWAAFGQPVGVFGRALSKELILSLMSAAIAVLTAVLAHFRWELGWKVQTEALFAMRELRAQWDAAVANARAAPDAAAALAELRSAYESFRSQAYDTVKAEMRDYFTVQKPPSVPGHSG